MEITEVMRKAGARAIHEFLWRENGREPQPYERVHEVVTGFYERQAQATLEAALAAAGHGR